MRQNWEQSDTSFKRNHQERTLEVMNISEKQNQGNDSIVI